MTGILHLFQAIGLGLVLLIPLVNPLTTVALLLGLSKGMSKKEINIQARKTAIYVFFIMAIAYYGGSLIMKTFGISIPGLRIAGGMIVGYIGFKMLFPHDEEVFDTPEVKGKVEQTSKGRTNIAFIPLAMPSAAGPGTIAMIISTASSVQNKSPYGFEPWVLSVAPVMTFLTLSFILWLSLISATTVIKIFGKGGVAAISRLMGFLLVCMGVQFIINGVLEIIQQYTPL